MPARTTASTHESQITKKGAASHANARRLPVSTTAAASTVAATTKASRTTNLLAASTRTLQGMDITPWKGEFINFDVDTTYVMPFRVCNRTSEIQTLRFVAPAQHAKAFRLLNMESIRLAPGLSHVLEVEFMTHTAQDYTDSFTILKADGTSIVVPLEALMVPELEYAPAIDFGVVEQHRAVGTTRPLRLVNRGRRDAVVSLHASSPDGTVRTTAAVAPTAVGPGHEDNGTSTAADSQRSHPTQLASVMRHTPTPSGGSTSPLVISPALTVAPALSETTVSVELPRDIALGHHHWTLQVQVDGHPAARTVTASVEVVDSRSRLIDPATGLETVSAVFPDKVYEGVKSRYPLRIANGSAQEVSFAFQLANDALGKEVPPFRLVPEQGRLRPRESREVAIVFEPPLQPVRTGWASQAQQDLTLTQPIRTKRYEALFSLLLVETEQTLNFHVAAESCETVVTLSHAVLDFGAVRMNTAVTQEITLRNGVADLPLKYAFGNVANFHVSEPTGTIPAGASVTLTTTFRPRRLGKFHEKLTVEFNGSTVTRAVTLVGHSLAANATGLDGLTTGKRSGAVPTAPVSATATAVDLPRPVDIGMIPGDGLRPPRLPNTAAELAQQVREDEVALRKHTRSGDHVAPVTFSDTRAVIKRTYPEAPTTAIERRDCRRELPPMDMLKVTLPVKVIDCGRITVGASVTRSLLVYNGTDGSVLMSMPAEEEPHVSFAPRTQVVPPSRLAHFNVTFTGTVVQTVQQVMSFTINGRYQMRFSVQAEVVPVEVTLSRTEVHLSFGAATDTYTTAAVSGDPVVQAQVVMTNSGSSPAPFRWALPPQSSTPPYFSVQPARGVLAPMSKVTADILYAPPSRDGTSEVTCDAVLSVDGALGDRQLRLVGVAAPTRCVWGRIAQSTSSVAMTEEVSIDLRRIAAGKEVALALPVHNRSKNVAFYSFESLPADISVTPARGRVAPGESEELLLALRVLRPGGCQHTLVCNVRGMKKPLRLHLRAEVVAPPLTISAPLVSKGEVVLDYGELYAGAERVRGVRFANHGDVPAVVELDLRPRNHHQQTQALLQGDPLAPRPRPDYHCLSEDVELEDEPKELVGFARAEVTAVMEPRRRGVREDEVGDTNTTTTGVAAAGDTADAPALSDTAPSTTADGGNHRPRAADAGEEMEIVPGLYLLSLPPQTESVVRIAFSRQGASLPPFMSSSPAPLPLGVSAANASHLLLSNGSTTGSTTSMAGAPSSERLYARWRQIGAEETHPLPSLVLQATTLPPRLGMRLREDPNSASLTGGLSAYRPRIPSSASADGFKGSRDSTTVHAHFTPVVAGRLPKPFHLELKNLSVQQPVAWQLCSNHDAAPQQQVTTSSGEREGQASPSPATTSPVDQGLASPPGVWGRGHSTFLVEPLSGTMSPGGSETVTVTFLANHVGHFTETYNLFADGDMSKLCGRVTFTGTATEPQIDCEQRTVVFPAVPLGVEVRQTIYLTNDGFDAVKVWHQATDDAKEERSKGNGSPMAANGGMVPPVSVRFPQGSTMSLHVTRIPVELIFRSKQPITLASSILLSTDREGQSIEVEVRATAINSIMATEPYVCYTDSLVTNSSSEAKELLNTAAAANSVTIGATSRTTASMGTANTAALAAAAAGVRLEPFRLVRGVAAPSPTATVTNIASTATTSGPSALWLRARRGENGVAVNGPNPFELLDTVFLSSQRRAAEAGAAFALDSLTAWLNGNLLAHRAIPQGMLIEVLQSTYGSALCDVIEALFGKRPRRLAASSSDTTGRKGASKTASQPQSLTDGKRESSAAVTRKKPATAAAALVARAYKGLAAVETLLAFVEHYGGCLSAVCAPFLLPFEEYMAVKKDEASAKTPHSGSAPGQAPSVATMTTGAGARERKSVSGKRVALASTTTTEPQTFNAVDAPKQPPTTCGVLIRNAADYKVRTTQAWMTTTLEVLRVFYLSRFAPENLSKAIPSQYAAAFPVTLWTNKSLLTVLSMSDVYSREECGLLWWVQWVVHRFCLEGSSPLDSRRGTHTSNSSGPSMASLIFGQALANSSAGDATEQRKQPAGKVCAPPAKTRMEADVTATPAVTVRSFADLHDARPLIAAVLFYVPDTRASFLDGDRKVIADPALRSDFEGNAELLMRVLGELGVVPSSRGSTTSDAASPIAPDVPASSWLPSGKEWVEASQTDILLFTAFLMSFLSRFAQVALPGPASTSASVSVSLVEPEEAAAEAAEAAAPSSAATTTTAKTTLSLLFQGKLLCPIERTVQIFNPATAVWSGARRYRVRLSNGNFSLSQRTISVPANGYANLVLSYTPRHHHTDAGQCLLMDETPSLKPEERTPLTLNLTVKPTDEPSRVFEFETPLYEPLHTEIPVENPFTAQDCCVVSVRLAQEYDPVADPTTGTRYPESEMGQRFHRAFFISTDVLPLRRNEQTFLPVHVVPLARGTYTARLTFREDREGEFSFLLRVRCGPPRAGSSGDTPATGLDFRAELDERAPQRLLVRAANTAMERAVRLYEEKLRQQQAPASRAAPSIPPLEGNTYQVSFVNAQLEGPNPFVDVVDGEGSKEGGTGTLSLPKGGAAGELRFVFRPKYVGEYTGFLMLTSPIDTRLIPFRGECVPRGEQRVLRFTCPARQHITQNLMLVNDTNEDWLLSATFGTAEGAENHTSSFSGPREIRVLHGRRKEYALKYAPTWITGEEEERGRLVLYNQTTGQRHTYELMGTASAPLSEDVVNLDCRAREQRTVTLTVPNISSADCVYQVDIGIPFATGEPTVTIPRGGFTRYTLHLAPTVGGNYTGKVVFRATSTTSTTSTAPGVSTRRTTTQQHQDPSAEVRYVWFLIHLGVTPPEKEGTVVLDTDVRTPVVADVAITNPLDRPLTFSVRRYGSGLKGANTFDLGAHGTATYPCTFTPSLIGEFDGRLSFFNDDVGEFWYEVKMKVVDSPAEEVEFEAALGTPTTATVRLPNRSHQDCQLMLHNSNTVNYSVSPAVVSIPAGEEALVDITYTPTAVGEPQTALLTFSHPVLGRWRYACSGVGTAPTDFAVRTISCELGATATVSLPFVNTLDADTPLSITVKARDDTVASFFTVQRAPAAGSVVPAGGRTTMVLAYRPRCVGHHDAVLEVQPLVGDQNPRYRVCWRFPLRGQAEWRDNLSAPLRFRCAARRQLEETLELRAPGLSRQEREGATLRFEPDAQRSTSGEAGATTAATRAALSAAVSTSFVYSLLPAEKRNNEEEEGEGGAAVTAHAELPLCEQYFRVHIRFTPLRPIAVSGDLVICGGGGSGGGIWRYRIFIEAPPAPIDDTITIASSLHTSTSVVFDLYNVFPYKSKFAAYFTPDSSKDLGVAPAHGVLMPFMAGQRGGSGAPATAAMATSIKVSFQPSLRVPQVEGTLVVDTEDMQWSFRVVGKLESHKRPVR